MVKWIVEHVIRPKWVSFEYEDAESGENELGIKVFGVVIALYKGHAIYPSSPKNIRQPGKYEFGASLYPIKKTGG